MVHILGVLLAAEENWDASLAQDFKFGPVLVLSLWLRVL